jgi:hypothetical protein
MCSFGADANSAGFASYTNVAYVDVTTAGDCGTSVDTQSDIETAALVVLECLIASGYVPEPGDVVIECPFATLKLPLMFR